MKRARAKVEDHPGYGTTLVLILVGLHALAAHWVSVVNTPAAFEKAPELASVYGSFAGVAALVAGFVGVVVVFSTVTGKAWSRVRDLGGDSLVRNWTSPIRVTLSAALLAIAAALLVQIDRQAIAWWCFEAAVLLVISAATRLLWLLKGLLRAQQKIDVREAAEADRLTLADLGMPEPKQRAS